MNNLIKLTLFFTFATMNLLLASDDMSKDSLEDIMNMESELKADIGSRSGSRSFLDSNSPIDIITSKQIEKSGLTSLTDVLRYFIAGFNAPETSVADGSDHIRAFTLRGMSPDQILVLVNGKRLHTSALLHVNGTIGRGSSGVDLDTIALSAIEKVEILRDGAAAQYGSDAISGVINIILKGMGQKNSISVHSGKRKSGDGTQLSVDTFISKPLKYDGFINLTLQAKNQEQTNHAGKGKTHVGIPDSKNFLALLNIEMPQENNTNIYANALFNYRDSEASAFFRPFNHDGNTTLIYPNGFLPIINAKIVDYSITTGVKGEFLDGYFWDLSNVYGYNNIDYFVSDSMNYSLGATSPTSFSNGSLSFLQNTTNLDLRKSTDMFELAGGLELRYENYEIKAGDLASYADGGSQGFSGYAPENEVKDSRNSYAAYFDTTYNISNALSVQGAMRYENFSDFGATSNVKLAVAYKATEDILLRTALSTGFRAPSLSQSFYSHTSTFGGNIEGTFRPDHEVSKSLGAENLKAEKSKHFTIGTVYQPTNNTFLMVDYFFISVDDRIMLSNDLNATTPAQVAIFAANNVSKARFFTNAVNTETKGIDIKFNHIHTFQNSSVIDFSIWYNYSQNRVVGFNDTSTTRANSFEQIDRIENGQPKDSVRILSSYSIKDLTSTLNISRYGSYSQVINNVSYKFNPAWTADLDISYKIKNGFNVALGANNILDTIPNKWNGLSGDFYGYDGIKPYSRYSPFGYSGAYYYVRATWNF
jgi:iron complex outermembrane receptor protein